MELDKDIDWERVARIAAESYVYTGWAMQDGQGFRGLSETRAQLPVDQYDDDIHSLGGDTDFWRLREGIERFMIGDT